MRGLAASRMISTKPVLVCFLEFSAQKTVYRIFGI
jgi:hypothetical protein